MGSGKTTVGPLVAAKLGWRFVDVDDVIEAEAGATIAEIFARHGEAAFREREHATIVRLAQADALVPVSYTHLARSMWSIVLPPKNPGVILRGFLPRI